MKVDDVLLKERVIASWAVVKGLKGINMRIDTFRVIRADVVKVIFVKIWSEPKNFISSASTEDGGLVQLGWYWMLAQILLPLAKWFWPSISVLSWEFRKRLLLYIKQLFDCASNRTEYPLVWCNEYNYFRVSNCYLRKICPSHRASRLPYIVIS